MKKFIIKSFIYFLPFCCFYVAYKLMSRNFAGDLGTQLKLPFKNYDQYAGYSRRHKFSESFVKDTLVMSYDRLHIDDTLKMITIGDSSSDQGIFGYQNYLAHLLNNNTITNIRFAIGVNQLNTAISLLNSGIIDSTNCRMVVLQIVGRFTIERLCRINFDLLYELPDISKYYHKDENKKKLFDLKDFCSFIRFRINSPNYIDKRDLKQPCFTHRLFSQKLFYYFDGDMHFLRLTKDNIDKAHENLIRLNSRFSEKGIKMIFLIVADKYDVYRPFMKDDYLPVDTTTNVLSKIPDVCVIDTKPLLQDMVRNGVMDVYMLHDTHWSYKASEAVARELLNYLK